LGWSDNAEVGLLDVANFARLSKFHSPPDEQVSA
jgi:hypothetical protein